MLCMFLCMRVSGVYVSVHILHVMHASVRLCVFVCVFQRVNPASMKQALLHSAVRLPTVSVFEQGAGRLHVVNALQYLRTTSPQVSLFPPALDLTDCPYMWPYCEQPLFATSVPVVVNMTVMNSLGPSSQVVRACLLIRPAFLIRHRF